MERRLEKTHVESSLPILDSFGPKSDGEDSPAPSSRYSSCGESDFERYCSANSVMGTPSVCSSLNYNECLESFKGLDDMGFDNFVLGGKLDRTCEGRRPLGTQKIEFCEGNDEVNIHHESSQIDFYGNEVTALASSRSGLGEGLLLKDDSGIDVSIEDDKALGCPEKNVNTGEGVHVNLKSVDGVNEASSYEFEGLYMHSDGRETDREEDRISSRLEHSEDEDSMYNYGSDDECSNCLYYPKRVQYHPEARVKNENPLLINSSVAFGSEDWDEFLQETQASGKSREQEGQKIGFSGDSLASGPLDVIVTPNTSQKGHVNVLGAIYKKSMQPNSADMADGSINFSSKNPIDCSDFVNAGHPEDGVGTSEVKDQDAVSLEENSRLASMAPISLSKIPQSEQEDVCNADKRSPLQGDDHLTTSSNSCEMEQEPVMDKAALETSAEVMDSGIEKVQKIVKKDEVNGTNDCQDQHVGRSGVQINPLSSVNTSQGSSSLSGSLENIHAEPYDDDYKPNSTVTTSDHQMMRETTNALVMGDQDELHPLPNKTENLELNESYDEVVNEMQEILLDSVDSPGARYSQGDQSSQSQPLLPPRDGGLTASTSGVNDAYQVIHHPLRIDRVEVTGAKQKKGDVSLSERLVGVKEYTVYRIRVWSGKNQWEVEHRYRDFDALYRQLKVLFSDKGLILPSPWSSVEKESRKLFGNVSPDIVTERSILIEGCLSSILHLQSLSSLPSVLIRFLSPQDRLPSSSVTDLMVPHSTSFIGHADMQNFPTLGKTISLVVEIQPYKSTKQMLEAQHYTCAGCHKHFSSGNTLMQDFVKTFGWGKPRLCLYTGQLFCASCHTNDTAVLPARVLHHWDFTKYPVSQMAKFYLDSIHDKPMLCVSAVNPFLFSKVPALHHVMGIRKRIGTMFAYVRCPFRRAINKGLGIRRYLLEGNDFFALRDLIDLSKGAFAALPVMVETLLSKITEHITEQCLVCYDVGVPCGAQKACNDPSSLIFPFQEGEIEKCTACDLAFHKSCYKNLSKCACGARLGVDEDTVSASQMTAEEGSGAYKLLKRSASGFSVGLLSGIFSKSKAEKRHYDNDNVILLGSLPSTSF